MFKEHASYTVCAFVKTVISIHCRTGPIADQTDGKSGLEHGPKPHAKTPARISTPSGLVKTAGPPESALQIFPEFGNIIVHMQLELKGCPGRRTS